MTAMASPSEKRDWKCLPNDILKSMILPHLVSSQDYIRFSVVCKHWHSVAKAEIQNHIATRKQFPFLLIPTMYQWSLYSAEHDLLLDSKLPVQDPYSKNICGSSHGWLILEGIDYDNIVTLFNPFTRAQISLPEITTTYESSAVIDEQSRGIFSFFDGLLRKETEPEVENIQKEGIVNAVLSGDPSLHPNDYMVAACIVTASQYVLALIQPGRGDNTWTTLTHSDWWVGDLECCDMIFDRSGKWVYAAIGYRGMVVRVDLESRVVEKVVKPWAFEPLVGYLAEAPSGGDLLMFCCLSDDEWGVRAWKLQGSRFVEVHELVGDTLAFIGHHSSATLVGRGFQGIDTDCMYFYRPGSYNMIGKCNLKDKEFFFDEEDEDVEHLVTHDLPSDCYDSEFHPVWILPGINL